MSISSLVSIALACVFGENFIFSRFFGARELASQSFSTKTVLNDGISVTVILTVSALLASLAELFIAPLGLSYLRTVIFVLLLSGIARVAELLIEKKSPKLFGGFKISVPIVAANAAFLGIMLLTAKGGYNPLEAIVFGVFAGAGYTGASALFAAVMEELRYSETPKWLDGAPIALITAGLIALAFSGFSGMKFM